MTVDENVKKAMGRIDRYLAGWRICQTPWQIIRTRLIELEALLADYENANKHSADDCVAKDVEITRLQSRLAAANALLREYRDEQEKHA